jgi:hypothetical protein
VPRPVLVVAIALAALLAVGVAVLGVLTAGGGPPGPSPQQEAARRGPLALPDEPAPQAGSAECSALVGALPQQMVVHGAPLPRRPLAAPAPASLAWGDAQHDPVVVRCGVQRPAELQPTSQLTEVSGVEWLQRPEDGRSTWIAVDRPVYAAVTVPDDAGTGPLQDVSAAVAQKLPKKPVFG